MTRPIGSNDARDQAPDSEPVAAMPGFLAIAYDHGRLLLVIGALTAMLAGAAALVLPASYKATAQLLVDPRDLKVLDNQLAPSAEAQNIDVTQVESQALVLGSEKVLRRAAVQLKLAEDPEFNKARGALSALLAALLSDILPDIELPSEQRSAEEAALERLKKAVQVYRINRSYVLAVAATASSKEKARAIVDAIVAAYLGEVAEQRANVANRARGDIDAGVEVLRRKVHETEQRLARYTQENNLVGVRGQIVSEQQLSDLNSQLVTARVETARLQARLDGSPRSAAEFERVPEAVASPTMRELRVQLSQVNLRKARLGAQLMPGHPDMRDVADQERAVVVQIDRELARIRESIAIQHQRAKETESALERQLEDLRKGVNTANNAQIRLREIEREVEANRSIYQQAVTRALQAGEQARLNTANVQVIAAASADQARAFPPPTPLLAGFGFVIGALAMFAILFVRALAGARKL